jgi:uncharacterized protein (TIGR02599 family)
MKRIRQLQAFTLVELLVACVVIVLVLTTLVSMTDQTQRLFRSTSAKVEQFQEARVAFESLTRRLSQATLNTYWDYEYRTVTQTIGGKSVPVRMPVRYQRGSELRFRSGLMSELSKGASKAFQPTHGIFFQAPVGYVADSTQYGVLDHLFNTWGFFLELNSSHETLPRFLEKTIEDRKRFRLMEVMDPTEQLAVYEFQQPGATEWFAPLLSGPHRKSRPLADNVVALVVLPRLALADEEAQASQKRLSMLAPGYRYDSTQTNKDPVLNPKHQLPPIVQIVMVAIDEPSAERLAREYAEHPSHGILYGDLFTRPERLEDNPATKEPNDGDVEKFTSHLTNDLKATWRVFSTNVSIRGAKWSRSQEN